MRGLLLTASDAVGSSQSKLLMGWAEISELLHLSTLPEERQLGRGERSQTLL